MLIFIMAMSVLVLSDLIDLKKQKRKGEYIAYFALTALALTGAWFYYMHPNAPSFAGRVLGIL